MRSMRGTIGVLVAAWGTLACSAPAAPAPPSEAHVDEHQHQDPGLPEPSPAPPTAAAANGAALVRLDEHAHVCMLSNRYLGEEHAHVPVTVEGKTYYGCCANCAARLAQQPEARAARDAQTGRPVDKGTAIRARDAQNRVLYFENEDSFAQMQRSFAATP